MIKLQKNILTFLLIMVILTPVGIFLPYWAGAGDAWGEWSPESVKEMLGYTPNGMEKNAFLWNSPLPDYSLGNESNSLLIQSLEYILSAFAGFGIIIGITYFCYLLFNNKQKN